MAGGATARVAWTGRLKALVPVVNSIENIGRFDTAS
jgi:hypothetical protein